jgi:hypothetical protein
MLPPFSGRRIRQTRNQLDADSKKKQTLETFPTDVYFAQNEKGKFDKISRMNLSVRICVVPCQTSLHPYITLILMCTIVVA